MVVSMLIQFLRLVDVPTLLEVKKNYLLGLEPETKKLQSDSAPYQWLSLEPETNKLQSDSAPYQRLRFWDI